MRPRKMRKTNAAKLIQVFFWLVYFIIESFDVALCLLVFASIDLQRLHLFLSLIYCSLMLNCCFCQMCLLQRRRGDGQRDGEGTGLH